jgi:hypothetical protein
MTVFLRFFAVPVRGSWILKLSGTGPVRGPSKKGTRTETGPDFKALFLQASDSDASAKKGDLNLVLVHQTFEHRHRHRSLDVDDIDSRCDIISWMNVPLISRTTQTI